MLNMAFGFAKLAITVSPNGDTYPEQAKHPDILFNSFCKCIIIFSINELWQILSRL